MTKTPQLLTVKLWDSVNILGSTCAPRSCSRGWPWRSWSRAGRCRCGWWSSAPSLWTAPSSRSSPRTPWWAASWSDRTPCIAATPCTALSHLLGVCPVPGVVAPRVIPGVTLETVDCVPSCKWRIFKVRNNIHHLLHLQSVEVDNMRPSLVATLVTVLHNTFTDYLAVKGKGESCQLNIRFASSIISSINILENRTLEFYFNSINKF